MEENTDDLKHEMDLITEHATGATEWHCPKCGYWFVMQFEPYKRIVLFEAGNQKATHVAAIGMSVDVDVNEEDEIDKGRLFKDLNDYLNNSGRKLDQ